MKRTLNATTLAEFLRRAGDTLKGRWLLVGGTLLPAVGIDVRPTVDIDLVGLSSAESAQQLELMKVAESLDLPVDTVNQAAKFFLDKAGFTDDDLIELHKGRGAIIFRPTVELYWKLKVARMSESDAEDCINYLKFCRSAGDTVDKKKLEAVVSQALERKPHAEKLTRVKALGKLI